MELAGIDVPIEAVNTTRAPGAADRPLNGVLAHERGPTPPELTGLRHWREGARADYMSGAGLLAGSGATKV